MDEAVIGRFAGSFWPGAGSWVVGARSGTVAGGERGDGYPLGPCLAHDRGD